MNNIKKVREEQGMKLYELANKSGLSTGYLCHLEKGSRNNPSYQTMVKIAKALNKEISEIFEIE